MSVCLYRPLENKTRHTQTVKFGLKKLEVEYKIIAEDAEASAKSEGWMDCRQMDDMINGIAAEKAAIADKDFPTDSKDALVAWAKVNLPDLKLDKRKPLEKLIGEVEAANANSD